MLRSLRVIAPVAVCLASAAGARLQAQSVKGGTFAGTVSDPTGARIPGAILHLQGKAGKGEVVADAVGHFSLRLPAGTYALTITAPGFDTLNRDPVAVPAASHPEMGLTLAISAESSVVTVNAEDTDSTDPASNRTALSLSGERLETLSDDDATFQQQIQAMAGGGDSGGTQIFVDGFSGGQFPPKSAIREIRINGNPFSAEYDSVGFGRIEIFTKPGADTYHGRFDLAGNDQSFNARNPYNLSGLEPPYHDLYFDGHVTGPIGRKTSFFLAGHRTDMQNNAVVDAQTALDSNGNPVTTSEAVSDPQTTNTWSGRLDRQVTPNNVLTGRYQWSSTGQTNSGVGQLVLPTEGVSTTTSTQTLQLSDTESIGASTVVETRFEYVRTHMRQTPNSTEPTRIVQGSFSGGGSPGQSITDHQDHIELQEYISRVYGKHLLRAGGRFRVNREANTSNGGYNGLFTYPSLQAYAADRPSEFTFTQGTPSAEISTDDLAVYAEDDWKLHKDVTFSYGLRVESQTAVPDHFDPAPRVGVAYSLPSGGRKVPLAVLRSGFGLFYDRFEVANLLTAVRQNGTSQLSYVVDCTGSAATCSSSTPASVTQPTIYRVSPNLRSEYAMVSSFSIEHSFGDKGSVSGTYLGVRGVHQYLSRNVNAPLADGTRPMGGAENVYQFSSDGVRSGQLFFSDVDLQPTKALSVWAFYMTQQRVADSFGVTSFPTDEYNLAQDRGRPAITNQRLFAGLWYNGPREFNGGAFLAAHSGTPFNITTGTDLNGDTQYNDRPSFATDLTRPSVVKTAYGNFDTDPIPGQNIIPINYGTSPGYVSLQLSAQKRFRFGPRPEQAALPPGATGPAKPAEPRYVLRFAVEAQNVLNHNNPGVPVGVIGAQVCEAGSPAVCPSTLFGRSNSLAENFNGITAANRTITLHTAFSF